MVWAIGPLAADPLRIATYNVNLSRDGPGLLLRDISAQDDAQVAAVTQVIAHIAPDILLITDFDFDAGNVALAAFAEQLAKRGMVYDHLFALRPNTGMATGLDMDGDGRLGRARDGQSYGNFSGQGGMAILSRWPIETSDAQDFSDLLWRDYPGADLPSVNGKPFPSASVLALQRLSTTGHWRVPVRVPGGGQITLLAYYATPPIFDGPEDRNGKRNHDETALWGSVLSGKLATLATNGGAVRGPLVILGDANLDPNDGDGRHNAMVDLLKNPRLQDARPASLGAVEATKLQGGVNDQHLGDPAFDTVDWQDEDGPGNLRVDYVVPSADLKVLDAGVFWPSEQGAPEWAELVTQASRHRLVWVDVEIP